MPARISKHVHFSEEDAPSPSYSVSTLPSSTGPLTPPPLGYNSPYQYSPLPGTALAHPLVTPHHRSFIAFDLLQPIEDVQSLVRYNRFPDHVWDEPATNPPVPFMEVQSPRLPWRIVIECSTKPYVTMKDLVKGIYKSLHKTVLADEYRPLEPSLQSRINEAFIFRLKQLPEYERRMEHAKGLRRIDFLLSHTTFMGIVPGKEGLNGWMLLVS